MFDIIKDKLILIYKNNDITIDGICLYTITVASEIFVKGNDKEEKIAGLKHCKEIAEAVLQFEKNNDNLTKHKEVLTATIRKIDSLIKRTRS
ncbi:hypothetical protein DEFDS_P099 (plasmid) [Deferribacter desulfuricans SSM1]|uniref:Uncharacterized protein n=1 Tax=Deferribacter desulfuricans (strain DSM 14783 / JCM 11476 / NBRC 101012 / SSM1) TaxID=639282 RepID=D3PET0_DEFDS|nr:hypothetical protein [Deferribacter desulfuricans]BAI81722.1 hypothetical protein DEFDS_P099 [Deferribacter desulfuricans SSM1]